MATFELFFLEDKAIRKEVKSPFYTLWEDEAAMNGILAEFGMGTDDTRILCGHVPVKVKDGEDPVKCNGKVIVLDGGMSIPYQPTSGVAGFTLICEDDPAQPGTRIVQLATHQTFCGRQIAIETNEALHSDWRTL